MTKLVRIENADCSNFRLLVEVFEKSSVEGEPDKLIKQERLDNPTDMTGFGIYVTSTSYIKISEY